MADFDSSTLFYDVFRSGARIVLSGPPLLNLHASLGSASYYDDRQRRLKAHLGDMDRTQRSFLDSPDGSSFITISAREFTASTTVGPDLQAVFDGLNVLFTKSKNNSLVWIRDWAEFHVKHHGVDGVLIYDNGSTTYAPADILEFVGSIEGLKTLVVVDWPFKFGPQGGGWDGLVDAPWDSDFCEYGIMEHARWRFLLSAKAVINADIDELVLTEDQGSVLDVLAGSSAPVVRYLGRWIENTAEISDRLPRFTDFSTYDVSRNNSTPKWVARPADVPEASQWKTHEIKDAETCVSSAVMHRHFMAINSDWKRSRTGVRAISPANQRTDEVLVEALKKSLAADAPAVNANPGHDRPAQVIPHRTLEAIRDTLEKSQALDLNPVKIWFYSSRCLVLDMEWSGQKVAVDVVMSNDDLVVKLHARTPAGFSVVERVVAQTGCPLRSGKYTVGRFPLCADLTVTGSALLRVLKNLHERCQSPADNA